MLLLAVPVVASAILEETQIQACVHDTGGNTKIVPVGTECGDNASPVLWNRQGPAGADGVSGYQVFAVPETQQDAPAGGLVEVEAACPVGKVPLGSGFASIGSARLGGFEVEYSIPSGNVWVVAWRNVTDARQAANFEAFGICAVVGVAGRAAPDLRVGSLVGAASLRFSCIASVRAVAG